MALAKTYSAVVLGVQARLVEVEAHLSSGLPGLSIVGLPDTTLNESRDRVRAAVVNSGLIWPNTKITVGLSPAYLPKRGSALDVAIALAILAADGQLPAEEIARVVAIGELGLDGRLRPTSGALAAAVTLCAEKAERGLSGCVITGPHDAAQLRSVADLSVIANSNLRSLVARLKGEQEPDDEAFIPEFCGRTDQQDQPEALDISDVKGQVVAKFAMEVAAAGGHHVALLGRPGVGKTLLGVRLAGLLPDLDDEQALEVTSIHQLNGSTMPGLAPGELMRRPPWAAPHHSASRSSLVGGGSNDKPSIGMVSLAHHGVLFLDEAAEFQPAVLDSLREPLESGNVTVARTSFRMKLPARFQLVMATNPCACGYALETPSRDDRRLCSCTPHSRRRYLGKLSGPLMDRIDLRVVLERPTAAELSSTVAGESTAAVAARVSGARETAASQLADTPWRTLGEVPLVTFLKLWPLPSSAAYELDRFAARETVRGRDRIARVAWTIAHLAGREAPGAEDVRIALDLRTSQQTWAA